MPSSLKGARERRGEERRGAELCFAFGLGESSCTPPPPPPLEKLGPVLVAVYDIPGPKHYLAFSLAPSVPVGAWLLSVSRPEHRIGAPLAHLVLGRTYGPSSRDGHGGRQWWCRAAAAQGYHPPPLATAPPSSGFPLFSPPTFRLPGRGREGTCGNCADLVEKGAPSVCTRCAWKRGDHLFFLWGTAASLGSSKKKNKDEDERLEKPASVNVPAKTLSEKSRHLLIPAKTTTKKKKKKRRKKGRRGRRNGRALGWPARKRTSSLGHTSVHLNCARPSNSLDPSSAPTASLLLNEYAENNTTVWIGSEIQGTQAIP